MNRTLRRVVAPMLPAAGIALALVIATHAQQQDGKAPPMSKEQQAMMDAMTKAMTPGKNHQLLGSLAGQWQFSTKMWMDPAAPPAQSTGSALYEPIMGGRYLKGTYKGDMMGMPFEGVGVEGYDNVTGKFQATWIDNMGTSITFMSGKYDPATKTITFMGEMPDVMKPMTNVKIRQVIRLVDNDHHDMAWYETRNGKEVKTMEINYTRSK